MRTKQSGEGLGENGIGSGPEKWAAFGLGEWKRNAFTVGGNEQLGRARNCTPKVHTTAEKMPHLHRNPLWADQLI